MSKYNKNEDIQSIISNLQSNCCLKADLQRNMCMAMYAMWERLWQQYSNIHEGKHALG